MTRKKRARFIKQRKFFKKLFWFMKSKAILTRQQCKFAFADKTSFFTDRVTVGSMDFDWLIPFTSNNVKGSITPISIQRKQTNQALHLKRTHFHENAAENGKKKESYGQNWPYVLNLKWLGSLVMVFYLFNIYLSELGCFDNFTESLVSRIDGFQLIDPFQWKLCDRHLKWLHRETRLNSLLLTKEMF